jgi:hypothetical protein
LEQPQAQTEARLPRLRKNQNNLRDMSQCLKEDKEPLYDYFQRFVHNKVQTSNFPEDIAIRKCTTGSLPGLLASHLSREPPTTLSALYAEMEKYIRFNADQKRRVEQRKMMR